MSKQLIRSVTFPLSATANAEKSLNASGQFVKVLYARVPILVAASGNPPVLLSSGQSVKLGKFSSLQIINPSVIAFTAYLLVGDDEQLTDPQVKRTSFFTVLNFNGTTQNFFGIAKVNGQICRRRSLRIVNTTAGILPIASDGILGDDAFAGTGAPFPQNHDTGWIDTDGYFQINSGGAVTALIFQIWEPIANLA